MDKLDPLKPLADFVIDYIKSDLERIRQPLLLETMLNKSKEVPEGKQIILKHHYGKSRQ
jgi:hypothetical protein